MRTHWRLGGICEDRAAAELARAHDAAALITARGYNRGRNLPLELNKLLDPTFGRG